MHNKETSKNFKKINTIYDPETKLKIKIVSIQVNQNNINKPIRSCTNNYKEMWAHNIQINVKRVKNKELTYFNGQ